MQIFNKLGIHAFSLIANDLCSSLVITY